MHATYVMAYTLPNSKCSNIICPAVEASICVKISPMNAKLPRYVKMSECEMEHISCYQADVSPTIVPNNFCAVEPLRHGKGITNKKQKNIKNTVESGHEDSNDGRWEQLRTDKCPRECPARHVMVCARCKHGVYRTFMSDCYMRMYQCKHPDDELELVARHPCLGSAPLLSDMPRPAVALLEPLDNDPVLDFLFSTNKSDEIRMDRAGYYNKLEHGFKDEAGYGTDWIFFPDGDGLPHLVNLTISPDAMKSRIGKIKEIKYRLYVRGIPDYILLDQSAKPMEDVKIGELLSNKPVKLVTHGWMSSAEKGIIMDIKDAYIKYKDVAVIGVDWSDTAMDYLYALVVDETGKVGSRVGQFLNAFCKLYDVTGDRLHLIGHSLGAHVMGIAASTSNMTIARITGLDPARPLFESPKTAASLALDSSNAEFVDVIHSCSGILGFENPIGHVDFYPNSGVSPQPGCGSSTFLPAACSHGRAHIYFAESIGNPNGFPACQRVNWKDFLRNNECNDHLYMGENVDRNATGQYYLKTNAKTPYARNN